ncbi:B2 protein-like [Musa acuminata AAA Group]|uniref:B2 protein-like n=1 Tax=Musa acuminata AAA Group TaxID=214697 RepID=UPI0031D4669C
MEGHGIGSSSSRENTSFWQFSDQLRLHTSTFSNLSLGDSIWSDSLDARRTDERRNLDSSAPLSADFNPNPWKMTYTNHKLAFGTYNNNYNSQLNRYNAVDDNGKHTNDGVAKNGNYFTGNNIDYKYGGGETKNYFNKAIGKPANFGPGSSKKSNINVSNDGNLGKKKKNTNNSNNNHNNSNNNNNDRGGAVDKRFKTLPPGEALPRNEAIGGYIFVCNNETMPENLTRQLFGLPSRYRDSVRAIKPGLPLFLYNYSTHQLYGIFEAASFGGTNIDPTAWEDKKCPGESRFPAQVRVVTRRIYDPLEEDAFRPILHHYDGPKFRLELNVEEALKLLDIFAENDNA